jgi:lipopolysaccharide export system permease protein
VILFRYLAREVLISMAAVSLVLLLVILSGRFVRYLAEAAAGKLDATVLFTLIGYRLPSYLELILPLGLFIAILLAYGRLYIDSEMTVLSACGVSEKKILGYSLVTGSLVAAVVAVFSLYLGPLGARSAEALLMAQRSRTEFETLKPGRFHRLSSGAGVAYVQSIDPEGHQLKGVFIAGRDEASDSLSIMSAQGGTTLYDENTGKRYLLLGQGHQYRGQPGSGNFEVVSFNTYQQYIPQPSVDERPKKPSDLMSTRELLGLDTPEARAALHWRLSMPVLVMIVVLLAVPLARTKPRTGRYAKLIPAILLYVLYLVMANAARGAMEAGRAPLSYWLWCVHAGFALLALVLFNPSAWRLRLTGARP